MAIRSFKGRETERLFREGHSGRWCNIASVAIRKLDMLDAAETLSEMRAPPGNTSRPYRRLVCAQGWRGGCARNQYDTGRPTAQPRVKGSAGWYNRLEALRGDRTGQDSVRINDQWRICFRWTDQGPTEVEIVDYHR